MNTYRCVVRSATDTASSQTLHVLAADCRAAATAAVEMLLVGHSDWIEVWQGDELVLKRRLSNLYPVPPQSKAGANAEARESLYNAGGKPLR